MTLNGWLQIGLFLLAVLAVTRPLGLYMTRVFERRRTWLDPVLRPIERLAQNLYISPPAVSQAAALGAFDGIEELEANRRVYAENRRILLSELPKAGLSDLVPPDGAFYIYADVSAFTRDSLAFARSLLEETGVAATPGIDFDARRGRQFLRLSYAGRTEDMAEAARRLKSWRGLAR